MMTMSKMFCLFLCLGCAVAQSSSDEEEQAQCDQCDNAGPASEFTECDGCGDIVCDDCRECGEDCFVCRDEASGAASTTRLTNNVYAAVGSSMGIAVPAAAGIAVVPAAENAAVPVENAQSSDDEIDYALVNAPAVLGNSTDTPSTETESDESTTESGTTAHYGVPRQDAIAAAGKISCVRIVSLFIFFYMF